MKKTLALVLVLVMCLSLCACGGKSESEVRDNEGTTALENQSTSKENMLASAETVAATEMNNAYYENKVKAKQTYCDKPIRTKAYVYMVNDDHAVLACGETAGSQVCIAAYMPLDDLALLKSDSVIEVVGIVSDITDRDFTWGGLTVKYPHYIMDTAYLLNK